MGARNGDEFVDEFWRLVHQVPAEQRAEVVADEDAAAAAQGGYELADLVDDDVDAVAAPPWGFVGVAEALEVEGHDAEVLGEGGDLVAPAEPAVWEAVEEED